MTLYGGRTREEWAEDHGYYHWRCRECGESGWTDTSPDCSCARAREEERLAEERAADEAEQELEDRMAWEAEADEAYAAEEVERLAREQDEARNDH